MPIRSSPDSTELINRLEQVIALLGFNESAGLVRSWAEYAAQTNRHVVRQAFETIGTHAVFGFPSTRDDRGKKFSPVLYLASASDDAGAKSLHRLTWSQGVVPILLVATPSGLQVRKTLAPPTPNPLTVGWAKLDAGVLPVELNSLTSVALSSSIVWRDYVAERSGRVDTSLLKAIASLNNEVRRRHPALKSKPALVNSLIGRFIYFFVLLDRGIISHSWMRSLRDEQGQPICSKIAAAIDENGAIDPSDNPWPAREVWALFDRIDRVLNGAIFPLNSTERRLLPAEALHLVRRAIRHGDSFHQGARQIGFLDVSFATLRTETISAIYELFLLIESPDEKDEEGAFYTPPFLVDYVLDEVDRIRAFSSTSRVLDPAAGSGIFLVGAYRRIIERSIPARRWKASHFQKARKLLEGAIFGIERNSQAANVARFSLYLTLLDYVESVSITKLRDLARRQRVFPTLSSNIRDQDVFAVAEDEMGRFTHVVGNPPWGTFGDRSNRTNVALQGKALARRRSSLDAAIKFQKSLDSSSFPVTEKRLSELFVWKIQRDLIAQNGVMGLLISTRSYVAPSAIHFPNALAEHCRIVGLANLSHFRYRLFSGARNPTLALFLENKLPNPLDPVWIYSPLLTSQPIGDEGHLWSIVVSDLDIEPYKLRDLTRAPEGWFWALMLRPIDRRFANHLRLWSSRFEKTLGHFLDRSELAIARGGSSSQTGVPSDLLLRSNDFNSRLGLGGLGFPTYEHERVRALKPKGVFAKLFAGNIIVIPRHMNEVTFIAEPIAFVSTFNAVYRPTPASIDRAGATALRGIARFLTSDIARYLYALFGKTRLLDRARLEKNDLESIPFPFEGLSDPSLQALESLTEQEITELFAARTGFDEAFVNSVKEYADFRHGYEDSKIPNSGLSPPDDSAVFAYKSMLLNHLAQQFGSGVAFQHLLHRPDPAEYFGRIDIEIGAIQEHGVITDQVQTATRSQGMGFSPHARITFDAHRSRIAITKPWTRIAWTMEQAYADARGISEEVLRAGASA
jgi:hypothetical protein